MADCNIHSSQKKRAVVAAEGEVATGRSQTPKLCMVCRKAVCNVVRCKECLSGSYCTDSCVEKHKSAHSQICFTIQDLERLETAKKYRELKDLEMGSRLSMTSNRDIIRLVGERTLVDVRLDGISCKCLWDTGSMISLINMKFLKGYIPNKKIYSIKEFLDNKFLSLSAANNTEVPIEGVVLLDFAVDNATLFQVPFLVTNENLSNPIIGYNTIEHLVLNYKNVIPSMMKMLQCLSVDTAKSMISAIEKAAEHSEHLGSVKIANPIVVLGNCLVRTKCKTRVERHVGEIDVLFSPLTEYMAEGDLIVYESTGKLKRGKSQFINVAIYNPISKEIFLKKDTVVGNVIEVNTIIQFPLLSEIGKVEINPVGVEETKVEKPWHEQIDLSHLNVKERKQVQKRLMEENKVFSKHKNDIGHIRDFKMHINLVDNTPVSESYHQIPRLLYDDVKNHINNLLAHGWVKRSSLSYASPIVCVRKKDGSLRLCIDFRKLNAKTISDKQPIPRVQDILDGLGGQEWFTTLTCRKRITKEK